MYTTHNNLEHTIKLQEELFRQSLRLRGIHLNNDNDASSEHFYDNIDGETSDMDKQTTIYRNRSLPWCHKKQQRTVRFSLNNDEQQKIKTAPNKVRFSDQYYPIGKRKNAKSSKTNRKLLSSNMLTVAIT
jgi:hypothetical protein